MVPGRDANKVVQLRQRIAALSVLQLPRGVVSNPNAAIVENMTLIASKCLSA
jgi:hypothetical protein